MNNRDPFRGEFQQPAEPAARSRPAAQGAAPKWRGPVDRASTTVPRRYRADGSAYRLPPKSTVPPAPSPSATRVSGPVRPERVPGGTALDGLCEQETEESKFSWRDLISRITRIDLSPRKASADELGLRDRIRTPVGSAFPIATLNLKGGVGKTVVVEALGSTFAEVRDDPVIAVDIDGGDLSERHGRPSRLSMVDLVRDNSVTRYTDVRAHTFMNSSGLEVLGSPDYASTDWRMERRDIANVFSILRKHYSVVLVDCVKSLNSGVMEGVIAESRALVVVTSTSMDAIRKTKTTLEWLRNNGYQNLLASTALAINRTQPAKLDPVAGKELEQLSDCVGATVLLPFDRHIQKGYEISLDGMSKESRRRYLELAAVLADMFPGRV